MLIILILILIQMIVVLIDNYAYIKIFYDELNLSNTASAFTQKAKLLLFSRTIFFIIPPILGLVLSLHNETFILIAFFCACSITLVSTLIQFSIYLGVSVLRLIFDATLYVYKNRTRISMIVGLTAFSIYLLSPFLLNYLASIYREYSLSIVQLNPLLTSFSTVFVTIYMEPKISKIIDKKGDLSEVYLENIYYRLMGRFLIFLISAFLFLI